MTSNPVNNDITDDITDDITKENMAKNVLEIKHLNFRYKQEIILKDISFSVAPGEFVSVIGPNGCGKTTLIKTILRSILPETGTIHIQGQEVNTLSNREIARHLAVVMQTIDPAAMTVMDYVQIGRAHV